MRKRTHWCLAFPPSPGERGPSSKPFVTLEQRRARPPKPAPLEVGTLLSIGTSLLVISVALGVIGLTLTLVPPGVTSNSPVSAWWAHLMDVAGASLLSRSYTSRLTRGDGSCYFLHLSTLQLFNAILADEHYKHLVPLLIPAGLVTIIVNWGGLHFFRHA